MKDFFQSLYISLRNKSIWTIGLLIIILSIFFQTNSVHAGLGFSPGTTYVEGLQPNTVVEREIVFSRDITNQPFRLDISVSGVAAEAITGPDFIDFAIGQDRSIYLFTISSGTLPQGEYRATVSAVTHKEKLNEEGGTGLVSASSSIILGAFADVVFSVTNEVKQEYSIKQIVIKPSEQQQPLGFAYQLVNTGNVSARPVKIEIAITNQDDPTYSYSEIIYGDQLSFVKAFGMEDVGVFTKAQLPVGKYWIDFHFYNDAGLMYELLHTPLQIFPPGTLEQKGSLLTFSTDKTQFDQNELIQFQGSFQNTGEIGLSAALVVDIKKGNQRIDSVKTEPVFIPSSQTAHFSIDKRLGENGTYLASAYVVYGIFQSETLAQSFHVGGLETIYILGGLGGIVLLIIISILVMKRRKRPPSKSQTSPNSSTSLLNNNKSEMSEKNNSL